MKSKITRKEFIQKGSIYTLGTLLAFSKLNNVKSVKAAVLDNTNSNDISDAIIYTETSFGDNAVFKSGSKASQLAIALNQVNEKFLNAIAALKAKFENALQSLKDTNLGKAVNANKDTFDENIVLFDSIKVFTNGGNEDYAEDGNIKITSIEDVAIPEGFYSSGRAYGDKSNPMISIDKEALLSVDNLRSAGVRTISDNGIYSTLKDSESVFESIEVNIDENSEGIGNSIFNKGYNKGTSDMFDSAESITVTASAEEQDVTPSDGKLLNNVIIKPQVHADKRAEQTITSNGTTTIDLGENHNIKEVPIKVSVTPVHSNTKMQALVTGTVGINVNRTGLAVITVGQQTNGMDLSPINIYGSGLVSLQNLGYVTVVNGARISAYTYLLKVRPGQIYVALGGSSYGATVANTVSYVEIA